VERNLTAARERIGALETENAELERTLAATRTDLDETRTTHGEVSQELAEIRAAAANVVEIRDRNTSLQQRLAERDREVEQLSAENARLAARSDQNWFIVGASVLLVGIVLGLVAPNLRRKRRSDW
jgi:SH3 domain protein